MSTYPPTPGAPPPPYSLPPRNPNGAVFGLGLAALICGCLGLLIAWIPFCGFVAWVPGGIGLILGIIAVVLASTNKGKMGLPISGAIISLLAIIMPFIATAIFGHVANKYAPQIQQKAVQLQRAAAEQAAAQANSPHTAVTLDQYNTIETGMTRQDVNKALGAPSYSGPLASPDADSTSVWVTPDGGKVTIDYKSDKVVTKNEDGLK